MQDQLQYNVKSAVQATQDVGVTLQEPPPTQLQFNQQVQQYRAAEVAKATEPGAGTAEKQFKKDLAADKSSGIVQEARRIARELGANGPITIDDVTQELSNRFNVLASKGKSQAWKGSVFTTSEWRLVGRLPSKFKVAHARPVGQWALKSWLQNNTLNGTQSNVSGFCLSRIFSDFKRLHGTDNLKDCNWHIGTATLSADIRKLIEANQNTLYGVQVTFVQGAVGAYIWCK